MFKFENGKADKLITYFSLIFAGFLSSTILLIIDTKSWVALLFSICAVILACVIYKVITKIHDRKVKNGIH